MPPEDDPRDERQPTREEWCLAMLDGVDLREGHIRDNADPDQLRDMLYGAGLKLADHEASFDLRHRADMRGIQAWRAAHPGNELVQPDHGDLVCWLIEAKDAAEADLDRLREAAKAVLLHRDREVYRDATLTALAEVVNGR